MRRAKIPILVMTTFILRIAEHEDIGEIAFSGHSRRAHLIPPDIES
jgi:hypothetical protein